MWKEFPLWLYPQLKLGAFWRNSRAPDRAAARIEWYSRLAAGAVRR